MKKTILFVDDDVNTRRELDRSLSKYFDEWDVLFAASGEEALELIANTQVDMLITDVSMPGMDGVELLEKVSDQFPNIVRMILSGKTDQETSLKSTRVAHQFLAKPCETERLVMVIRRAFSIRELLAEPNLIRVINSIKKLPSLPRVYFELTHELRSPSASSKSVADIVAQDISMTAKVLQLVNSAFYGLPYKVTDLQRAVTFLGVNTLLALALAHHVFTEFQGVKSESFSIDELWDHSYRVSSLSRSIARAMGMSKQVVDDAQVIGIMHDIGKLIQLSIPGFYEQNIPKGIKFTLPLEKEYDILGTSHCELGAYLLGIWGLPDDIVHGVAYHHVPAKANEDHFSGLTAVYVANVILRQKRPVEVKALKEALDLEYLARLNVIDRLDAWVEHFERALLSKEE